MILSDIISHDEYHIQDPMTLDLSSFVEQLNYFKRYFLFKFVRNYK